MGAELGAIASTAASLGGAGIDAWASRENAKDQMHFQEKMSNTAHFREVQDLIRAGLNPILSAKYGGASTPPGANAGPTNFANSAQRASELANQGKLIKQQIDTLESEEFNKSASGNLAAAQADATERREEHIAPLEKELLKEQIATERAKAEATRAQASRDKRENEFYEANPYYQAIDKYLDAGGKAVDLINPLKKIPGRDTNQPQYRKDYKRNRYDKFDPKTGEIFNR